MWYYRRLLNISYKDHVTNEEVRNKIQNAFRLHDDLLTMVKKRKHRLYGHISRCSGMANTILQRTVKESRRRGRQKKRWEDNIKANDRNGVWRFPEGSGRQGKVERYCCNLTCGPSLRDWDEMRGYIFIIMNCIFITVLNEPWHDKTNKMVCAPSKDSDQSVWFMCS